MSIPSTTDTESAAASDPGLRAQLARLLRIVLPLAGLATAYLAVSHFSHSVWPLAHANVLLVVASSLVIGLSYVCRAIAWQLLFRRRERPCRGALMAASGAASVSGTVLPGRLDWAVKFVVLRKLRRKRVGMETIAVSLGSLALLDAVAIAPLAVAAIVAAQTTTLKAASAVVLVGGVAAAVVYLRAASLLRHRALNRWPKVAGILESAAHRVADHRDSVLATLALTICWICRAAGLLLLLAAMEISFSPMLALVFVVLTAAAVVINFLPIGPAVQLGAGTAVLIGSHISAEKAATFALASNLLFVFAAATGSLLGVVWYARHGALSRLRAAVG
jgi:uncharacterized membrane protein YbhN (UPF0104 family)